MTKREEVEQMLGELTQAELSEMVLFGSALLHKARGNGVLTAVVMDEEVAIYFKASSAAAAKQMLSDLLLKNGGTSLEIKARR